MDVGVYGADVIAKLLEITPRRLQQLAKDGYIPKASRGKYSLVGAVQGYVRFLRAAQTRAKTEPDDDEGKMTPRDRLAHYNAELKLRELQIQDGELYVAHEHDRAVSRVFKAVAAGLETLPDVLERDAGLDGHQLECVFALIDKLREQIYLSVAGDE